MTYSATLDTLAKIITAAVMGAALAFFLFLHDSSGFIYWFSGILLVIIICYVLRPLRYELYPDKLIIHRIFKPIIIDRKNVFQVECLKEKDMLDVIRIFGSGGLFGYFGKFRSKGIGRFSMQATRRQNMILIVQYTGNKYTITPDDEEFLPALKKLWRLP